MSVLRSPLSLAGAALLGGLLLVGALAPVIAPYDPHALAGEALEAPSSRHLLGTDGIGQDLFSRVLWGARTSLTVALGAAGLAMALAVLVGVTAALLGGAADTVAMRVVDVFLALPGLPLLVLVAAMVGANRLTLILLIGVIRWPELARVLRGQTLTLRQRGFVASARGFGGGLGWVLRRHLVPALAPLILAGFITVAGTAVLMEAGLAFLGLSDPTAVSWGGILNRALLQPGLYFTPAWTWWVLPAGFAITLTVLGFTFLAVGLEPALNPRWRRAS
ncbi:MAG: ABC transporter permease [Euzebyales bacterium]|jgi:ABC-type dipeptide/oligopeptide/nickel transport system permease subunit|nr:ABC transporter permease [Euzebyales bacterium]